MELEMSKTARDQEHELAHTDREPSTRTASQPSQNPGFVVTLWLLALLMAEIEFWILAFTHMYRM
jgi:hypothetical protein